MKIEITIEKKENKNQFSNGYDLLITSKSDFKVDGSDLFGYASETLETVITHILKEYIRQEEIVKKIIMEMPISSKYSELGVKAQIREIIKSYDKEGGINKVDIYYLLKMVASNEYITFGEVEEHIRNMLNDGEVYESKPQVYRWLD